MPRLPSGTQRTDRQKAERKGRRGETLAALYLMAKGYQIIGRRVRNRAGEIDLIAKRGRLIAFVEVKHRARNADKALTLLGVNRRRIIAAAQSYLSVHPALCDRDLRFDIIYLEPGRWPHHMPDAFGET